MKIRKSDSSISILLFIFNVFLSNRGTTEISLKKILELLKPFDKNETAIRMGLSRGLQNGIFVNKHDNEIIYQLTDKAIGAIHYWWNTINQFQERAIIQQSKWDRKWHLIYVDKNKSYIELGQLLKHMGYSCLNNSTWISPYNYSDEIMKIVKEMKAETAVFMFQSEMIENRAPEDLVEYLWDINTLTQKYNKYVKDLTRAVETMGDTLYCDGKALPFLHKFGTEIFGIIEEDPQLPMDLLPGNWQGIQAVKKFAEIRKALLPSANLYIDTVLAN